MTNLNQPRPGSKGRFRISLLLLAVLFVARIWTLVGHKSPQSVTASSAAQGDGFTPVDKENANVWGLAGDLLGLFSGGRRSSAEIDRELNDERAQRQAAGEAEQRRDWKEDEERRADEHDQWEQAQEDQRQQKRQEQDDYDRRQQEQQRYDEQRRQEQNY